MPVRWLYCTLKIMISNSQRVGMATFPHTVLGSVLKIGPPEVWCRAEPTGGRSAGSAGQSLGAPCRHPCAGSGPATVLAKS